MALSNLESPKPELDLVLDRVVDAPLELIWSAWTKPEHIKKWFAPAPWTTIACEIDLRPGGIFRTVMRSPEGEEFPITGCYLEIIDKRKLIWTSALGPGFRPNESSLTPFTFTAVITLQQQGRETKYVAHLLHSDAASRKRHDAMGFQSGWAKALDQLVALTKTMPAEATQRPAYT